MVGKKAIQLATGLNVAVPVPPCTTPVVHVIQVPGQEQSDTTEENIPEPPETQSEDTLEVLDNTTIQVVNEFFTSD